MSLEDKVYLVCEECGFRVDNPENESLVKGDRCPECYEGYLMEM